jgi:hypothetical protein
MELQGNVIVGGETFSEKSLSTLTLALVLVQWLHLSFRDFLSMLVRFDSLGDAGG